jgi:hypothetical protein
METFVFYAISWAIVFSLLALWSLVAWSFHSVAVWAVSNTGLLAAGSGSITGLPVPAWLSPLIPPEIHLALTSGLSSLIPIIEGALAQAPALAGGLSVTVWVVWAIGAGVLVLLGVLSSGLISMLRRRA